MRALMLAGLILQGTLLLRPLSSFLRRPFVEDAFYSLTVSAWLAEGRGLTVDGVHPTNGVQPLLCFLYVPGFLLVDGDRLLALVPAMVLQSIIFASAAFCIASFASSTCRDHERRGEIFWLVGMLTAWSAPLLTHMLNGLETGLAVGFAFGCAAYYNRLWERAEARRSRWLLLGLLLGVAVLARIDIAFLVAAVCVWHALRQGCDRRRQIFESAIVGLTALVTSLPWWIYNVTVFGSLMPISGQAQLELQQDRWLIIRTTLEFLADSLIFTTNVPYATLVHYPWLGPVALVAIVAVVLFVGRSVGALRTALRQWPAVWNVAGGVPMLMFTSLVVLYYTFIFGSPHFTNRYIVSWRILCSFAVITVLYLVFKAATRVARIGMLIVLGGAMMVTIYGFTWSFTGQRSNPYVMRSDWISERTSPHDRVATFQSGTAGYVCRNVINLDGKVNAEALAATQKGRLTDYIVDSRFEYVMDWPELTLPLMRDARVASMYESIDTLGEGCIVYRRRDLTGIR